MSEILIIILVLLVFFGNERIKEMARNAGKASREVKKIKKEYEQALEEVKKEPAEEALETKSAPKKTKTKKVGVKKGGEL